MDPKITNRVWQHSLVGKKPWTFSSPQGSQSVRGEVLSTLGFALNFVPLRISISLSTTDVSHFVLASQRSKRL